MYKKSNRVIEDLKQLFDYGFDTVCMGLFQIGHQQYAN